MHKHKHMYDLCKKHMHSYVLAEMNDGTQVDGIVTGLDDEYVYMAVPNDPMSGAQQPMTGAQPMQGMQQYPGAQPMQGMQQYPGMQQPMQGTQQMPGGQPGTQQTGQMMRDDDDDRYGFGYGFPGYGFPGYGFGYPGYFGPGRRFRRLVLPLAALTALSVLPWY
ncbi:hypothetical protein SAMN05216389_10653 [Oceanobacillus limi]|uniref:Uncharacterized protein n=1 Tax=Oceanobacillus limi TaxID=930131 RepID=A0A1I0C629_9BACI|nr:hypothetical protein [Oceanobacillus limi]SET14941.1 hypothetical protein SAMN05216389_10653 [Oceanobacillus limi]